MLKSQVPIPNFYSKMPLGFTFPENSSSLKQFKSDRVYLMEDLSDFVKNARYKLKDLVLRVRQSDLMAYLSFNKLIVTNAQRRINVYTHWT